MDQARKRYPKLKAPERKIARMSMSLDFSGNETAIVSAEDSEQHAIWQSFEQNFAEGMRRIKRELTGIPRKNLRVYLYPNAQRSLRDSLVAITTAAEVDKLTNLLEHDSNLAVLAHEMKPVGD